MSGKVGGVDSGDFERQSFTAKDAADAGQHGPGDIGARVADDNGEALAARRHPFLV